MRARETAMRIGEALRLEWTDLDFERNIITLNNLKREENPGNSNSVTQSWPDSTVSQNFQCKM